MSNRARHLIILVLITLIALGLRVWALDEFPPGATHDEAAHLHDAQRIWDGYRPIYLTTAYGREPLYDYASAPLVGLLGMTVSTGRLASALWGTALVVLLYAWVAIAFDWPTAALAAALVAFSFWPLSTSRQVLRSSAAPVMATAAVIMYWRAVYPRAGRSRKRHFVIAGLLLGLALYTYPPSRVFWLVPTLSGLCLALTDRPLWRRIRLGFGLMLLAMALIAVPLVRYLATHPELEVRVDELAEPIRALQVGDPGPLWARLGETVLLLSHQGDTQWMYNIAGRPLLPPVLAVLFCAGLGYALMKVLRERRSAPALLLLWLVIGMAPALVTGLESSSLRAIAAQPAVFVLVALPVSALGRSLWTGLGRCARAGFVGLVVVGLLWLTSGTVHDYFRLWGTHRDTRVAYHAHVVEVASYLDRQPETTPLGISTMYPGPLHDPSVAELVIRPTSLVREARWYDARYALVFPRADRARAVFPALTPLDPVLQHLFGPVASLVERIELSPDDLSPWFDIYVWAPNAARNRLLLSEPIDLGHALAFVGYDLRTPAVSPGGILELITFWEPIAQMPAGTDLVLFTHLLGKAEVAAQQDRLDVPSDAWQPGDLFAQLHRFSVPTNLPGGLYQLETGAYLNAVGYPRLPVYRDGEESGNRILLEPIQVVGGD
jgi:4-amino-4-deoxy-L-arabinose transferase-like glycosyltransferase